MKNELSELGDVGRIGVGILMPICLLLSMAVNWTLALVLMAILCQR